MCGRKNEIVIGFSPNWFHLIQSSEYEHLLGCHSEGPYMLVFPRSDHLSFLKTKREFLRRAQS